MSQKLKKVDIIWNITSICMWDCGVCCVDAVHVTSKNDNIISRSENLAKVDLIKRNKARGSIFDQVLEYRIASGLELSLVEKLQVIENLKGYDAKIDFSGGDPLSISNTRIVMEKACEEFGRENITLTATGAGLARIDIDKISSIIGELNFTYDSSNYVSRECRPKGYAHSNLKKAAKFAKAGVKTRGETPLSINNIDKETLISIYQDLHDAYTTTHLIMRLFPSGRGCYLNHKTPSVDQYKKAIEVLYELENKYIYPKIKLQCALKFLDPARNFLNNPCDMVTESFGLMPNGILLASPWAIGRRGNPVSELFVLGNLSKTTLFEILATEKAKKFVERADENFGHCKMQAFFNADTNNKHKAIFEKADPLYTQ